MAEQNGLFGPEISLKKISFTQISTFLRCPLEFKLRFIEKREIEFSPSGSDVFLGRILHKITFDYLNLPPSERNLPFLSLKLKNLTNGTRIRQEHLDFLEESIQLLDRSVLKGFKTISTEESFKYTIENYTLSGRIDCLSSSPEGTMLLEFKLNNYPEFVYENAVDQYLQLIVYSLGLQKKGITPTLGAYYFYDSGFLKEIELSPLLETGEKRIRTILQAMSNQQCFLPRANPLCSTCGYRNRCALYQKGGDKNAHT